MFSRETATQPLHFLLSFTVVPWVVNGVSLGVGQEALESHICTQLRARWNVFNFALGLDAKLAIVAISMSHNTHPLDGFHGKGLDMLLLVANQAETANPTAIGEGDMLAIIVKLPASLLVLNRAVIVLKLGIALLSRLVLSAIGIEPINSEPCTVSTRLTSLGVESGGKMGIHGLRQHSRSASRFW